MESFTKRLGYINQNTSAEKAHEIMENIILPEDRFDFHILLITHGRKICKANNPKCSICPLTSYCPSVVLWCIQCTQNKIYYKINKWQLK